MKLKKLFAGILAVAMMATMAAPAFAARTTSSYTPVGDTKIAVGTDGSFTIRKDLISNDNGTAPAEVFELTAKPYSSSNTSITDFTTNNKYELTFANATKKDDGTYTGFKATVPNFEKPGVFVYELKETDHATAGMTYDSNTYYLTVYAFNKADSTTKVEKNDLQYAVRLSRGLTALNDTTSNDYKVDTINNSYAAEPLSITKTVNGNMGDRTREFEFTVKFEAPTGKTVKSAISVTGDHGEVSNVTGGTLTNDVLTFNEGATEVSLKVMLKHGQTVNFTNLPTDVKYTVTETKADDYKTYVTVGNGDESESLTTSDKIANAAVEIKYENVNGDTTIDTGVILDNAPYIALMMVVVAGAAVMIIKKRRHFED